MKFGNPIHGSEHSEHLQGKEKLAKIALAGGADAVFFEKCGCDVVALKRFQGKEYLFGLEYENTGARSAARNAQRDIDELGCHFVLFVAKTDKIRRAIIARFYRLLPLRILARAIAVDGAYFNSDLFRGLIEVELCRNGTASTEKGGAPRDGTSVGSVAGDRVRITDNS